MTTESIDDLKKKIGILECRIALLKEHVDRARWLSEMLVRAKAPDPRFPYWEWEFRNIPTETVQRNLLKVCFTLSERVNGTWEFDETCKDIPGIPSDQLYQARPPTVDEVYTFIKAAAGFTSNAQVTEMFVVMRMNQYQNKLIDFVLSG